MYVTLQVTSLRTTQDSVDCKTRLIKLCAEDLTAIYITSLWTSSYFALALIPTFLL